MSSFVYSARSLLYFIRFHPSLVRSFVRLFVLSVDIVCSFVLSLCIVIPASVYDFGCFMISAGRCFVL